MLSKKRSKRFSPVIAVFAKEPVLGKVKTRMERAYPRTTVLELYQAFVLDTLEMMRQVPTAEKWIFFESWGKPARFLRRHAPDFSFSPQKGKDLGERLSQAYRKLSPSLEQPVVIIGSDTPHLDPRRVSAALRKLRNYEAVIGPANDGGFYLLGMRFYSKGIFEGISWSTNKVLRQLLRNLQKQKLRYCLLPEEFDLDTPTDLRRLLNTSHSLPENLRRATHNEPHLNKKFKS